MGNRILGASVKLAVNTAAMKQVAAAGFSTRGSCTSWSGRGAFVTWSTSTWERDRYANRPIKKFRINYPAMPDDALLTRREADLIAAYTLHETGHVLYTNNNDRHHAGTAHPPAQLARLANGIEDARMEHTVIQLGAKNAKALFTQLLGKLTGEISRDYNPCELRNAPFTLALLCRQALGNGNAYTAGLLARIPEPQRSVYAHTMERMATAPVGFDTYHWSLLRADDFLTLWQQMRRKEQREQQPERPEPPPGEPCEDGDSGDDDAVQDTPPTPDSGSDDEQERGDDGQDDDKDDAEDDEWRDHYGDDEDDGQPEDDDGQDFSDGGDDDTEPPVGKPTDVDGEPCDDGEPGEDGGQDDSDDGEGGNSENDDQPFNQSGNDSGEQKSPEPTIDDIVKRINKRTASEMDIKLSAFSPASRDEDIMDFLNKHYV